MVSTFIHTAFLTFPLKILAINLLLRKLYRHERVPLLDNTATMKQWKYVAFSKLYSANEICPKNEKSK